MTNHLNRRMALARSAQVALMLGGLGLLPRTALAAYPTAAFEAKTIPDLMKALGAGAPVESKDVTVTAPDIAENGAVVPVSVSSKLAKTEFVAILVDKNPQPLAAGFNVPEGSEAAFTTRIKMGTTSQVHALVKADGKWFVAGKEIKVTLGGCGG